MSIGDTEQQVLDQCGEPSLVEGNRWFYDSDLDQKVYHEITFDNGGIAAVEKKKRRD